MRRLTGVLVGFGLVSTLACSGAKRVPQPVIDPSGPSFSVRVSTFKAAGAMEGVDEGSLDVFASRVCAVFLKVGQDRINCLTDSDVAQLGKSAAMRISLGGCDESEEPCGAVASGLDFDLVVRGVVSPEDDRLLLELTALDMERAERVASSRATAKDVASLFDEVDEAAKALAIEILSAE